MSDVLYEQIQTAFDYVEKPQIPNSISDNIKQPLRAYQTQALENFIFYLTSKKHKDIAHKHLLFHMATGSGKTNIIVSAMLYLYERGYRDFIFFVNTTNIITKTKDNIINKYSSKYLFQDKIIINNTEIKINEISDTFDVANKDAINIMFTTTHKLHGDLETTVKENSITYADFEKRKIVLIADEAHHLNSELKKSKNKEDEENLKSWGMTTKRLLKTHKENILLEFTATAEIHSSTEIAEHYKDKMIAEYPLVNFRKDRYSKEIKLINDNLSQEQRILQAIMISEYRQIVAREHLGRVIKPVVMFKNPKGIASIDANFEAFKKQIESLHVKDIEEIFSLSDIGAIKELEKSIKDKEAFVKRLKYSYDAQKCIVIYSTSADKEEKLKLLNSLEDMDNPIRAIFAVNVLNEGWDVLNLFDIVKLDEAKTGATNTTSEAQLIGRGARYYPFEYKDEDKYKRKFDEDFTNPLRYLEQMYFHSVNKSEYIAGLKKELSKIGLMEKEDEAQEVTLRLKESFLNDEFYKSGVVYVNAKIPQDKSKINSIGDYVGNSYKIQEIHIDNSSKEITILDEEVGEAKYLKPKTFKIQKIDVDIVRVAINKKPFFYFSNLKRYFKNLKSINEFITSEHYLGSIEFFVRFVKEQEIDIKLQIKLILEALESIEKGIVKNAMDFVGSKEFYPVRLSQKIPKTKTLKLKESDSEINQPYDWYVFEPHKGTSEERAFVDFILKISDELKDKYSDIKLIRNEKAFNIHSFDGGKDGAKFEPDFLLMLKNETCYFQIFCEPKGEHLLEYDSWKNDFLNDITKLTKESALMLNDVNKNGLKLYENSCYKIYGLPFYNHTLESEFKQSFRELVL